MSTKSWITENFPAVVKRMPENVQEFQLPTGSISGLSTHPELLIPDLFLSENFFRYFKKEIPEDFFTAAIEGRRISERLIVFWKKEGRQFYFNDGYMYVYAEGKASPEITNEKFEKEASKWERREKNKE